MILRFLTFSLAFSWSWTLLDAAECQSQPVSFTKDYTSFEIQSQKNDTASKNCYYQFVVPKYFVPQINFTNIHLTGDNQITMSQFSQYGGFKSWQVKNLVEEYFLGPTNFTLEISLPQKTEDDSFNIVVSVKDATPYNHGQTFMVRPDLGRIIDFNEVSGNSSIVQMFDNQHPQSDFQIRLALFTDSSLVWRLLSNIHVYDLGVYKGSLLDVWLAQNSSIICSGSQFALVNTNSGVIGVFSILIMPKNDWSGQISLQAASYGNSSQSYTATNGATVFHEITNPISGYLQPTVMSQFSFRGDGTLQIYGGCVPGAQEQRRIATITPSNADAYDQLMIYGRCRTYVLSQGVIQWFKQDYYATNYKHKIGRKGAIMSASFPYESDGDLARKYLIQSPNDKENIIVTYEVAYMAGNVAFDISEGISGGKTEDKTLTASDTNYTSPRTFQQMSSFTVPKGSDGFLIRYTVTSSSNTSFGVLVLMLIMIPVFNHGCRV